MKKAIPPLMLAALSMAAIPGHAQENERLAVCELTRDIGLPPEKWSSLK